jgi:DNA-binding transcriptional MerR regulator
MTIVEQSHSISEVAELTGLTTHTLRYYERTGLMLSSVDRASSTHRRYSSSDVGWVGFLTKLRSTGMPIARVREYVELARQGDGTTGARLDLLVQHREAVVAQLAEVTRSLAAIDSKIALYQEKEQGK